MGRMLRGAVVAIIRSRRLQWRTLTTPSSFIRLSFDQVDKDNLTLLRPFQLLSVFSPDAPNTLRRLLPFPYHRRPFNITYDNLWYWDAVL